MPERGAADDCQRPRRFSKPSVVDGVYDAERAENGRWTWFWTSPGGATFDSPAIYATKEAALYAARAWVRKHYKG